MEKKNLPVITIAFTSSLCKAWSKESFKLLSTGNKKVENFNIISLQWVLVSNDSNKKSLESISARTQWNK